MAVMPGLEIPNIRLPIPDVTKRLPPGLMAALQGAMPASGLAALQKMMQAKQAQDLEQAQRASTTMTQMPSGSYPAATNYQIGSVGPNADLGAGLMRGIAIALQSRNQARQKDYEIKASLAEKQADVERRHAERVEEIGMRAKEKAEELEREKPKSELQLKHLELQNKLLEQQFGLRGAKGSGGGRAADTSDQDLLNKVMPLIKPRPSAPAAKPQSSAEPDLSAMLAQDPGMMSDVGPNPLAQAAARALAQQKESEFEIPPSLSISKKTRPTGQYDRQELTDAALILPPDLRERAVRAAAAFNSPAESAEVNIPSSAWAAEQEAVLKELAPLARGNRPKVKMALALQGGAVKAEKDRFKQFGQSTKEAEIELQNIQKEFAKQMLSPDSDLAQKRREIRKVFHDRDKRNDMAISRQEGLAPGIMPEGAVFSTPEEIQAKSNADALRIAADVPGVLDDSDYAKMDSATVRLEKAKANPGDEKSLENAARNLTATLDSIATKHINKIEQLAGGQNEFHDFIKNHYLPALIRRKKEQKPVER